MFKTLVILGNSRSMLGGGEMGWAVKGGLGGKKHMVGRGNWGLGKYLNSSRVAKLRIMTLGGCCGPYRSIFTSYVSI